MNDSGYWSKYTRVRPRTGGAGYSLSRRRVLVGGSALALGSVAWAACGGGDDGATEEVAPRPGGTLRTGTSVPYSGLDPHTEAGTGLAITARLYGYMLHVDSRDDAIIYDQAESVEQVDATTYVFHLREGARFHDIAPVNGRSVTSADVVRSIERFRDNPISTTKIFHTTILDRVEAVDPRTVRVTTKKPYVYTLAYLGDISAGAILPAELIDRGIGLYTAAVGSGPFQLETGKPPDTARIVRHPDYYRAPIPYLEAMEWRVFNDERSKQEALANHEIDLVTGGSRQTVEGLSEANRDIEVTSEPSLSWLALGFRMDRAPVSDERVRGAIDLALDRDAMIRDIASGEGNVLGPVNPQLAGGYWSLPEDEVRAIFGGASSIDERRAAARQLVVAAGAEGASFKLQVANSAPALDLAAVVRQQMEQIGLRVELEPLDLLVWFANFRRGAFEATLATQPPYETPDVPLRFFHSAGPDGSGNPFAFIDGTVDTLVERSWGESDRGQRRETILEAQRIMMAGRPILQLYAGAGYSASWESVRNRRPGLPGSLAQYNYEQWIAT